MLDVKKLLAKEKGDHMKTLDNFKKLEIVNKELDEKVKTLMSKQYEGLFDEDHYLKPLKKMNF